MILNGTPLGSVALGRFATKSIDIPINEDSLATSRLSREYIFNKTKGKSSYCNIKLSECKSRNMGSSCSKSEGLQICNNTFTLECTSQGGFGCFIPIDEKLTGLLESNLENINYVTQYNHTQTFFSKTNVVKLESKNKKAFLKSFRKASGMKVWYKYNPDNFQHEALYTKLAHTILGYDNDPNFYIVSFKNNITISYYVMKNRELTIKNDKTELLACYLTSKCDGSLDEIELSREEFMTMMTSIMQQVNQLHNNNLFHLDIKPDNILKCGGQYRLIDFGLASKKNLTFSYGTSAYAHPALLKNGEKDSNIFNVLDYEFKKLNFNPTDLINNMKKIYNYYVPSNIADNYALAVSFVEILRKMNEKLDPKELSIFVKNIYILLNNPIGGAYYKKTSRKKFINKRLRCIYTSDKKEYLKIDNVFVKVSELRRRENAQERQRKKANQLLLQ